MSSLLDQAIIDAKDLREAAMKSAEQSILEMYAPEVKKAVETILNTEEPIVEEVGEVSLAAADGENLCPCPKEDEPDELEIDFEKLEKMISDEEVGMGRDELAMDLGAEDELKLQEDADATEDVAEEELEEEFELSEELELEEDEEEEELEEEIKIDFDPTAKLGWFPPAESQEEYRAEMLAALDSLKAKEEELEENKNFQAVTKNKNIKISKALVKLQDRNEQYTNVILQLEGKINELLLINSRLLFSNRVLESISLNERQKTRRTLSKLYLSHVLQKKQRPFLSHLKT